jgi:predicted membrane protein
MNARQKLWLSVVGIFVIAMILAAIAHNIVLILVEVLCLSYMASKYRDVWSAKDHR